MSWENVLKGSKGERAERRKMRAQDRKEIRERDKKIQELKQQAEDWDYWHEKYVAHAEELNDKIEENKEQNKNHAMLHRFFMEREFGPNRQHYTKTFPKGEPHLPEGYRSFTQLKNAENSFREDLAELEGKNK